MNPRGYTCNNPRFYSDPKGQLVWFGIPAIYYGYAALTDAVAWSIYTWNNPDAVAGTNNDNGKLKMNTEIGKVAGIKTHKNIK